MLLNCGVGEDSWESLGQQGDQVNPKGNQSLNIHWRDRCWCWSSSSLATWFEEQTLWKRPWCWKRLRAGGEEDDGGWDGWMASPTQWTWVWASSASWWWTGMPGMLQFMALQRGTDLSNWTTITKVYIHIYITTDWTASINFNFLKWKPVMCDAETF